MAKTIASISVSATTSEPRGRVPLLLLGALCLLAAAGIPCLELDPEAPFRLDIDDPVGRADRALRSTTGGDDLVALVVWDQRGPVQSDSLGVIDAAFERLSREPALLRSRSVTRAPILSSVDGTLTAETPLHPVPPAAELESALTRVLTDPFVGGALITPDGTMAILPSWVRRQSTDATLVQVAAKALVEPEVRATDEGKACKQAVDQARLAVVLGDAAGPADMEVARRLRALGADGNGLADRFVARAGALVADPDAGALEAVLAVRDALELPTGVSAAVLGEAPLRAELSTRFPVAIALLILGAFLGFLLAGGPGPLRLWASLAAWTAAAFVAGGMGWVGAPLHSLTALCIPVGALLAGAAAATRVSLLTSVVALLPLLGLALTTSSVPGLLPGLLLASATGVAAGLFVETASLEPEVTGASPSRLAMVFVLAAAAVIASQPMGVDPSRLLDARTATGEIMAALDTHGMATPAQIALDGGEAQSLATPQVLLELADAQRTLNSDPAVLGTVSWADFISALHGAVSGGDGLPTDAALVDQYLLLFGRPEDVRPLVAQDFSVGGGILRLRPGQGASLGALAGPVGAGRVVVTGGAARVARSGWLIACRGALGGALGLLLALGLALGPRTPGAFAETTRSLAGAAVAVGVTTLWSGAMGFEATLAGATVWFLAALGGRRSAIAGLGAGLALASPVVSVASFGCGVAGGCAALWFLRRTRSR